MGTTTPDKSGPGSDGNKWVLCIPQSSSINIASSDCLESYPGLSPGKSYLSAEMQSVYSAAPADWVSDYYYYISWRFEYFKTILFEIVIFFPLKIKWCKCEKIEESFSIEFFLFSELVWFGCFIAYTPLRVIQLQILFIYINFMYMYVYDLKMNSLLLTFL